MPRWSGITSARRHFNDGSVDMFAYRTTGTAEHLVRKVLRGEIRAVELRLDTGQRVVVRPNPKTRIS